MQELERNLHGEHSDQGNDKICPYHLLKEIMDAYAEDGIGSDKPVFGTVDFKAVKKGNLIASLK